MIASSHSFTLLSLSRSLQHWEQGKRLGCKSWELPQGLLLFWKANQTSLKKLRSPKSFLEVASALGSLSHASAATLHTEESMDAPA